MAVCKNSKAADVERRYHLLPPRNPKLRDVRPAGEFQPSTAARHRRETCAFLFAAGEYRGQCLGEKTNYADNSMRMLE
jgi:hypothetical protein